MKKVLVFQHIQREHPSTITSYAKDHGIQLDVIELWKGTKIPNISNYEALIVLGGPMGVYDEYPGKHDEIHSIRNAVGIIPTLGICLGAQLIAHVLGSNVYPFEKEGKRIKEIGYYDLTLTDEGAASPLFANFPRTFQALQWHGDTYDHPQGAVPLVTADVCPQQAFARGNTYGLQFHVEATPELVSDWIREDATWAYDGFEMDEEKLKRDAEAHAETMKQNCYLLLDNFLSA
jgi:GMP synthase-like glutamine amidotransferase